MVMVKFHVNFRFGNRWSNRDPSDASNGFHLKSRRFAVDMGPPLFRKRLEMSAVTRLGTEDKRPWKWMGLEDHNPASYWDKFGLFSGAKFPVSFRGDFVGFKASPPPKGETRPPLNCNWQPSAELLLPESWISLGTLCGWSQWVEQMITVVTCP